MKPVPGFSSLNILSPLFKATIKGGAKRKRKEEGASVLNPPFQF